MANAAIGEVDITLNGKPTTLKSTLAAAKRVNGIAGGYMAVLGQLGTMNHDAYVQVVAAGMDKKPSEVEDDVFRTGLLKLTEPLSTFVEYLVNGGKPAEAAKGSGSGEE
jgi:hypothetical protein